MKRVLERVRRKYNLTSDDIVNLVWIILFLVAVAIVILWSK